MCGIVGVVDYEGAYSTEALRRLTQAMRDDLAHRGPDDAGLWVSPDGRVCLGQRRLAVIDLRPEGRQPMANEDDSVVVTFNGEIYNFRALRDDLESRGHRFRSRTDTEVLCHLLEGEANETVPLLEGMFAFAAWRDAARELVLARDPFGKKPLYYLQSGRLLAFASELKPLQRLPERLGGIDNTAVQQYLLLQYIPAPRSIYHHVRKVEPGCFLRVQFAAPQPRVHATRYFRFRAAEPAETPPADGALLDSLQTHLTNAVRDRLMADVPLGAFLSGGNDSSLVVALMARELGVRVQTFSVGFAHAPASEHLVARQIAGHLGTEHHELLVEPSAVELLPEVVASLDEPNGDSSCLPTYLLSRFAREHVTVALSGDGGDEIFGGYGRYGDTVREAADPRTRLRWLWRRKQWWTAAHAYVGERILPMTEATLRELVHELEPGAEEFLHAMRRAARGRRGILHDLRTLDAATYLPGAVLAKVDRMSMRFALEVRSPFLDVRLARWASRLPARLLNDGRQAKILLKRLACRYLPEAIVHRPKQGFGIPDRCWSQERLLDLAHDLLLGPGSRITNYLDSHRLRAYLTHQRAPGCFQVYQVWEMLVLEQWLRSAVAPAALAA